MYFLTTLYADDQIPHIDIDPTNIGCNYFLIDMPISEAGLSINVWPFPNKKSSATPVTIKANSMIIRKNSLVHGGCFSGPNNEPCHRLHIEVALDAASHPQLTRIAQINSKDATGRAFSENCLRRDGSDFKYN